MLEEHLRGASTIYSRALPSMDETLRCFRHNNWQLGDEFGICDLQLRLTAQQFTWEPWCLAWFVRQNNIFLDIALGLRVVSEWPHREIAGGPDPRSVCTTFSVSPTGFGLPPLCHPRRCRRPRQQSVGSRNKSTGCRQPDSHGVQSLQSSLWDISSAAMCS